MIYRRSDVLGDGSFVLGTSAKTIAVTADALVASVKLRIGHQRYFTRATPRICKAVAEQILCSNLFYDKKLLRVPVPAKSLAQDIKPKPVRLIMLSARGSSSHVWLISRETLQGFHFLVDYFFPRIFCASAASQRPSKRSLDRMSPDMRLDYARCLLNDPYSKAEHRLLGAFAILDLANLSAPT
jgi:hypothetical protein